MAEDNWPHSTPIIRCLLRERQETDIHPDRGLDRRDQVHTVGKTNHTRQGDSQSRFPGKTTGEGRVAEDNWPRSTPIFNVCYMNDKEPTCSLTEEARRRVKRQQARTQAVQGSNPPCQPSNQPIPSQPSLSNP